MKKTTAFTEEEIAEMMKEAQETKIVTQKAKVEEAQAKLNPEKKQTGLSSDSWAYGVSRGPDGKYQVVEVSFNAEKGTAKFERVISRDSNKMVAGMKAENATRQVVVSASRKK